MVAASRTEYNRVGGGVSGADGGQSEVQGTLLEVES